MLLKIPALVLRRGEERGKAAVWGDSQSNASATPAVSPATCGLFNTLKSFCVSSSRLHFPGNSPNEQVLHLWTQNCDGKFQSCAKDIKLGFPVYFVKYQGYHMALKIERTSDSKWQCDNIIAPACLCVMSNKVHQWTVQSVNSQILKKKSQQFYPSVLAP